MDKHAIIFSFYKFWINKLGDIPSLSLISNIIDEYDKIVYKNEPVEHPPYISKYLYNIKSDIERCVKNV